MLTSPAAPARRYKLLNERQRARIALPQIFDLPDPRNRAGLFDYPRSPGDPSAAARRSASSPLRGFFNFSSVFCPASHEMNTRWMHRHLAQVAKIKERASINPPFPRLCSPGRFSAPLFPFPGRTHASAHTDARRVLVPPRHSRTPSHPLSLSVSLSLRAGFFPRSPL